MTDANEAAIAHGGQAICNLAGCFEVDFAGVDGGRWYGALNGHGVDTACSRGAVVPPFAWYVEWNGWPFGTIGPNGGLLVAGGAANERSLLAATRAEIARVRAERDQREADHG